MNFAAKNLQILKRGCLTHISYQAAQKIYTIIKVSRAALKISVTNSVSDQMWKKVSISPSVLELWGWIVAWNVFFQNITMSQWSWPLTTKIDWTFGPNFWNSLKAYLIDCVHENRTNKWTFIQTTQKYNAPGHKCCHLFQALNTFWIYAWNRCTRLLYIRLVVFVVFVCVPQSTDLKKHSNTSSESNLINRH